MAIYNGDLLMKARGLQGQEKPETPAKKQHTANKTYKEAAERKDQLVYATQEIKARLKMQDVLDRYYHTGPHNKICCPFHEEKTPSFSYKDDFYKCFGCGESGDTIKFVQRFFDLPFAEAVQKLDDDFGFGNLHPLTERQKAEIGKRRQQAEEKRLQEQQKADERNGLLDELAHLDQEKERLRPQPGATEEQILAYTNAVSRYEEVAARVDEIQIQEWTERSAEKHSLEDKQTKEGEKDMDISREDRAAVYRAKKENLNALCETYEDEYANPSGPKATLDSFIEKVGADTAIQTVAELVNLVNDMDGRVERSSREWAKGIVGAMSQNELESIGIYLPSKIHPAHIQQLAWKAEEYAKKAKEISKEPEVKAPGTISMLMSVSVHPIKEPPESSTGARILANATVTINKEFSLPVIIGENKEGKRYVSYPYWSTGEGYHDYIVPRTEAASKALFSMVLKAYDAKMKGMDLEPQGEAPKTTGMIDITKMKLQPGESLLATATINYNNLFTVRGVRVAKVNDKRTGSQKTVPFLPSVSYERMQRDNDGKAIKDEAGNFKKEIAFSPAVTLHGELQHTFETVVLGSYAVHRQYAELEKQQREANRPPEKDAVQEYCDLVRSQQSEKTEQSMQLG